MTAPRLPVVVRPRAQDDIDDAIDHYLGEADIRVAERFAEAILQALDLLGRNPRIGAPRDDFALPGLRCWGLRPWPQLLFYADGPSAVDVIRVLHGARDIPGSLAEPEA